MMNVINRLLGVKQELEQLDRKQEKLQAEAAGLLAKLNGKSSGSKEDDVSTTAYQDLPFAESVCHEGVIDRACWALGIDAAQVKLLRFELREVVLDADHLGCLWTEREWRQEVAERPGYLGPLAANIDNAPAPLLAPNVTGSAGSAAYEVLDGVHRLNGALHSGRSSVLAWVAVTPDRNADPA